MPDGERAADWTTFAEGLFAPRFAGDGSGARALKQSRYFIGETAPVWVPVGMRACVVRDGPTCYRSAGAVECTPI
jgi:hypothetical protein